MSSGTISASDETTWPSDLRSLVDGELSTLAAYERERQRLDEIIQRGDLRARFGLPDNRFGAERERLLGRINNALVGRNLLGWHCTRLHEDEVAAIWRNGLAPLQADFLARRISEREAAGDIPPPLAARLLAEHQAGEKGRANMLWFIFTRPPLQDELGLKRLFRHWGGEALYNSHERDAETGPLLRGIGTACIVEASVPVDEIETFMSVGERLVNSYLGTRGIECRTGPEMEGYVSCAIGASAIHRIVQRSDPDFEAMTGCTSWKTEIT